ncbi:hypothetical protein DFA_10782 [Cavenderia fasciculata]|uniref:Ubiquitin-like protease family profile domain-containing protein n=1 Tax=Cavenderia fasciculata TaxID=261658 RepID=F4QBD7_CACFS|nr:uncharacterized protein DFA_10782 [Cavenderia fasciculata]EGG14909.1 hypothetical protein DFA_10782 [Cavenderia fasciculata]|eukprot:XP_004351425.1 hypothetical protein DFA_10782 [Cavenderia fasciculata]
MKPYKKYGWSGVFSADEVDLARPTLDGKLSFIMNLDKSTEPGSHWVACYIDTIGSKSLEYYDSFGEDPSEQFMIDIKKI